MKKILLTLFLILLMIPTVNADEIDACYKDYLISTSDYYLYNKRGYYDVATDSIKSTTINSSAVLSYLLEVTPGKTYYLRFFNESLTSQPVIHYYFTYDADKNCLNPGFYRSVNLSKYMTYSYNEDLMMYTITWNDNLTFSYMSFNFYPEGALNSNSYFIYADYDLSTCPPTIEEPEEPIIVDTTLDNFYTIYLDKLKAIGVFATENKFALSAFVIILVLLCLELFLYLCKGGYRR